MALRLIGKDEQPPFNGKRLQQARELRGLTVEQLAEDMDLLPFEINLYEIGGQQPDSELEADLAMRLGFPITFFYRGDPPELGPTTLDWHINKKKKKGG